MPSTNYLPHFLLSVGGVISLLLSLANKVEGQFSPAFQAVTAEIKKANKGLVGLSGGMLFGERKVREPKL